MVTIPLIAETHGDISPGHQYWATYHRFQGYNNPEWSAFPVVDTLYRYVRINTVRVFHMGNAVTLSMPGITTAVIPYYFPNVDIPASAGALYETVTFENLNIYTSHLKLLRFYSYVTGYSAGDWVFIVIEGEGWT